MHDQLRELALREVAFGERPTPGIPALAAACASDDRSRLLAAVVLGALGNYGPAARVSRELSRVGDPVLASLAMSTFASHRRQLGDHAAARTLDARALRMAEHAADRAESADQDGLDRQGARADALIGLAADNVGLGDLLATRRLLDVARAADSRWRSRVRLAWVAAECALAGGRSAEALGYAQAALRLAHERTASRHITKSRLVLAAALAATGLPEQRSEAAELALRALRSARAAGWRSLSWPALLLVADLDAASADSCRAEVTRELHAVLLDADPRMRRMAHSSGRLPP